MANDGYRDRIEALDPVAYWRLDDASGTTAAAAIGGQGGSYRNGVALATPGVAGGGSAARFDGQNDDLVIDHAAPLRSTAAPSRSGFRPTT